MRHSIIGLLLATSACSVPGTGFIHTEFQFEKRVHFVQTQPTQMRKELSVYEVPQPKNSKVAFPYFAFEDTGLELTLELDSGYANWRVKNTSGEAIKLYFDRLTCLDHQETSSLKIEANLFSLSRILDPVVRSKTENKIFDKVAQAVNLPTDTIHYVRFTPKNMSKTLLTCMQLRSNSEKLLTKFDDTIGQEILLSLPFERKNGHLGSYHIRLRVLKAAGREIFS